MFKKEAADVLRATSELSPSSLRTMTKRKQMIMYCMNTERKFTSDGRILFYKQSIDPC